MKKLTEFLCAHRYAIIWTVCYAAVMWAILAGMFNFDLFSVRDWTRLIHAELHGFAGFVFGILILSAIPMYIATTTIIIRTKKPLFTIKLPTFMMPTMPTPEPEPTPKKVNITPDTEPAKHAPLPSNLPNELRAPFLRARERMTTVPHILPVKKNTPEPVSTPHDTPDTIPTDNQPGELPLPTDFDITQSIDDDTPEYSDNPFSQISNMVFKDIDFDTPSATPAPTDENAITKYISEHNLAMQIAPDGLIICNDLAIAVHDDPDFWIADTTDWFATGKQKPSPISTLQIAAANGQRPVLYLGETNIMDLDTVKQQWEHDGITVITNPNQLPL